LPYRAVGARIKRLREAKGLSRRELAARLSVDITSLSGWEAGKRLPRERYRLKLAHLLGTNLGSLFAPTTDRQPEPVAASIIDTMDDLPKVLNDLLARTCKRLRALRVAAPYPTPAHVQREFRVKLSERILAGTVEVQRVEIFYDLRRLQEVISNLFRYAGRPYHVKSYCAGFSEVVPALGGYFFDDDVFMLGAYWTGVPPHQKPGVRLSGDPFRIFFGEYWDEIWRRGKRLSIDNAHELAELRTLALKLGLPQKKWKSFLDEAKALQIGDGAPPLV
jgi:transcriptional regulator with XRE-family HTH domain